MSGWEVFNTDEYGEWFIQQSKTDQAIIRSRVELLKEHGPNLSRPYADTLKGSKISNLKELRTKSLFHVFRIAYCFDEKRNGLLLIGGDKKGKGQERFYKNLIKDAERIYDLYRKKTNMEEQ
jgi:hypothetical protein